MTPVQRKVFASIAACRTAKMGTHTRQCDHCGKEVHLYNSCGDRHCPKCQGGKRAAWFDKRRQDLLPVEYFHVVFTIPEELNILAAAHPGVFYKLLLRAARETLLEVAATSRKLGGEIGGLMLLHTWGQNLLLHPHVHVIVPGGAISPDGSRWVACPRGFFLPVKVLSRVFRGKLLAFVREAYDADELPMTDGQAALSDSRKFRQFLSPLYKIEWVVYAKPPLSGAPEQILKYLAQYMYRVAISNERLESISDGKVRFRYKDYARGHRQRRMTLDAEEFLRRLSQHVLPRGFVRVRSFGFLANSHRAKKLSHIRGLLNVASPTTDTTADSSGDEPSVCPHCRVGLLWTIVRTGRPRVADLVAQTYQPNPFDTS
jgi:hypothetical protein